ncbi:MAG: ATP-binding protein [Pseudomonadota bacterium]
MFVMSEPKIKRFLPKTLYGRAAAILLLPILTIQLAVGVIFIQRHFEDVTNQMTNNLVREIDLIQNALDTQSLNDVQTHIAAQLDLTLATWDQVSSGNKRLWYDISGRTIIPALYDGLIGVQDVDLSNVRRVSLAIDSGQGLIEITFARDRVSASNPHQLLVLMTLTGVFMTALAFVFMRNQLRPIKRLADAANAFGRGQIVPLRPSGAIEVRSAAQSFLDMRGRIERQIEQRTMMLSGVSHDLRTPLTRMQLGLEMLEDAEALGLKKDVTDMAAMLDGYLNYAKDAAAEDYQDVALKTELQALVDRFAPDATLTVTGAPRTLALRKILAMRALENLISNGVRYGDTVQVGLHFSHTAVEITIEDDGLGIPASDRDAALRPFVRLNPARTQNRSGVGLGLAIATDAIKSHGGTLTLGHSDTLGGLRVDVALPLAKGKR